MGIENQKKLISEILESSDFDEADKAVIRWQFRMNGDFKTALWQAIILADEGNLLKLSLGFPDEVKGYLKWSGGDQAARFRATGLEI